MAFTVTSFSGLVPDAVCDEASLQSPKNDTFSFEDVERTWLCVSVLEMLTRTPWHRAGRVIPNSHQTGCVLVVGYTFLIAQIAPNWAPRTAWLATPSKGIQDDEHNSAKQRESLNPI